MRFTLPTGATVEGTESEVRALVTALGYGSFLPSVAREGDGIHYNSSSKGLVRIKDMDTRHLVNATRKRFRSLAETLPTTATALSAELLRGIGRTDVTFLALVAELKTRRD